MNNKDFSTHFKQKNIVITGASDGIGAQAAYQLKSLGHNVIVVGRTESKVKRIATDIDAPYHIADFSKLDDVLKLASQLDSYDHIDVLANNAGAMMNKRTLTENSFELTFQVNVLAPFLLTKLLCDKLCKSNATVIQTSSIASKMFGRGLDLSDINHERSYTPVKAYGEAKLCNILFTKELHNRYFDKGINSVAFQPGVPRTNFASQGPAFFNTMYHSPFKYLFTMSASKSAKRLVRLATGEPEKDFICGRVYSCKKLYNESFTNDHSSCERLWNICEKICDEYLDSRKIKT